MATDRTGRVDYSALALSTGLSQNMTLFQEIFSEDATFQFRPVSSRAQPGLRCALLFLDGMVDSRVINDGMLLPITTVQLSGLPRLEPLLDAVITGASTKRAEDVRTLAEAILAGDTVVLLDGEAAGGVVSTRGFALRGISEPDDERSLRGPREGFTEALMTNASMLRRKLQTSDLKFKACTFGTRSNTRAFLCYLDSLVDRDILAELERRLDTVVIDGALDVNYLIERIRDARWSIFKTCGSTEKPDIAAARLLEGRIALILDGTPIVMTVPYLFVENLQAPDDYYTSFYFGSVGRLMRFFSFWLSISAPAIYVSLVAFHPEMIPTSLMLSIAAALSKVPFPTVLECIGMQMLFEILRETGIRMPSKFGQALGIVGALIVGQAAVEARIVSAPVVIVVALSGITGLMVPRLGGAVLILRLFLVTAAAWLGFYGYFLALLVILFYLTGVKSFGVDYTSQLFSYNPQHLKDIYIRAPIPFMTSRPLWLSRDTER